MTGEECEPCLSPPFYTLEMDGGGKLISDSEGRTLLFEHRNAAFVDELCKIMNENKDRLVDAWKRMDKKEPRIHGYTIPEYVKLIERAHEATKNSKLVFK